MPFRKIPEHYTRWVKMIHRCHNPKDENFKGYGARGIFVCPEWRVFKTYQEWCLKNFDAGKTVDRKDNDGPYSPKNCRWATRSEQMQNSRFTPEKAVALELALVGRAKGRITKYGDPENRRSKRCHVCSQFKHLDDFHRNRAATDGRHATCIPCRSETRKK